MLGQYIRAIHFIRNGSLQLKRNLILLVKTIHGLLLPCLLTIISLDVCGFLKIKRDYSGRIVKFKARVCARGDRHTYEIDYYETFAPTLRYTTYRVLLSIAYRFDLEIKQFDVVTAFLNAHVDDDIYMYSPPVLKVISPNGVKPVCKLNRSLYGIEQAPRSWQSLLSSWLVSYVFCQIR